MELIHLLLFYLLFFSCFVIIRFLLETSRYFEWESPIILINFLIIAFGVIFQEHFLSYFICLFHLCYFVIFILRSHFIFLRFNQSFHSLIHYSLLLITLVKLYFSFSFILMLYFILLTSNFLLYFHLLEINFYLSFYFVLDFYEQVVIEELFLLFSFLFLNFFLSFSTFSIFSLIRKIHRLMVNDIIIKFILPSSLFIFLYLKLFLIFLVYFITKADFVLIFHQQVDEYSLTALFMWFLMVQELFLFFLQ